MNTNTMYIVKNRSASMVVYRIPEKNIRREFAPGEVKKISGEELIDLSYQSGGRELMANFLQIQAKEVTQELNIHTEPEYNYSEQDIAELIKTGSLDAFLDCLDFAPVGVLDILKSLAVKIPLSDFDKRKALKEKTGFDLDKALNMMDADEDDDEPAAATTGRRVKPAEPAAEQTTARRTNYKVVTKTAEE